MNIVIETIIEASMNTTFLIMLAIAVSIGSLMGIIEGLAIRKYRKLMGKNPPGASNGSTYYRKSSHSCSSNDSCSDD